MYDCKTVRVLDFLLNISIVLALEEGPQVCQVCEEVFLVEALQEDLVEALVTVEKEELV